MRECVALDVQQRNVTEIVGTLTNRCDRAVTCGWCPANGDRVDKGACRSATIAAGQSRTGQAGGLWYDGFRSLAYDCTDASDSPSCLATPASRP
jgi:hypothetical protein